MNRRPDDLATETTQPASSTWEPPRFEVISLDCEISAYAPDDRPLF